MKKILFILVLSLLACRKTQVIPTPTQPNVNIFDVKENSVENGQTINFTLLISGTYTLTMFDTIKNQVVTRERFIGKLGLNSLKIYTKSLPTKYLSVELKDQNNQQIGKTRIIIK